VILGNQLVLYRNSWLQCERIGERSPTQPFVCRSSNNGCFVFLHLIFTATRAWGAKYCKVDDVTAYWSSTLNCDKRRNCLFGKSLRGLKKSVSRNKFYMDSSQVGKKILCRVIKMSCILIWARKAVEPTAFWTHPTVNVIAAYVEQLFCINV